MIKISELTERIEMLPTLPSSFHEFQNIIDKPQSNTSDIAEVVRKDHVITARILKLINSSFYGLQREVSDVEKAIKLLGRSAVKNLVFANSILKAFSGQKSVTGLWDHALAVGVCSKNIGARIRYREIEELFLCGLLHDIGKVVQIYLYPLEVIKIVEECVAKEKAYSEIEKKHFEASHDIVGRMLLEKWNLPERICTIVECHQHPLEKNDYQLESTIVYTSDAIVRFMEIGDGMDGNVPLELNVKHYKVIGLDDFSISEWTEDIIDQLDEIRAITRE